MSGGLLIQCPGCGAEFAVRVEQLAAGQQPPRSSSPPRQGGRSGQDRAPSPSLQVAWSEDNGWELECPQHGWHAAREWPASGRDAANVKCTGKTNGKWCDVRIPLEEARRRAGR